ncbi:MarR family winged helix-turn-helix transcriptional regulator [Oceanibacterium hippocampi]|uniref:MarR family protein n=1 Tax=Oceanibacterium hippocampi TaxID=745714 RepID=A0A1Y5SKY0_9PROT|nr:MarR family winged helix-turn-helix transcriptional regulator [Oceanibacterium hippocampi]SLN41442.1 MarR family protein [Oceanibacterium hippocampi]
MSPDAARLDALIREIRGAFNRLKAVAERLHRESGVNASMRAVMEALGDGPRPVPDIARARGVSRQHIQVNMDALAAAGLVEAQDNPAHRRSPLYALTPAGVRLFGAMRAAEAALLERLAGEFPPEALGAARTTTAALNRHLDAALLELGEDDGDNEDGNERAGHAAGTKA